MLRKRVYKILSGVAVFLFLNVIVTKAINIDEFITKSYEVFFNRKADKNSEYWAYSIKNHENSLYDYIVSILSGDEFLAREISNEQFINMIYKSLMNRLPSEEEFKFWLNKLEEENKKLNNIDKARVEVSKIIMGESFFKELANDLKVTDKFKKLNNLAVEQLRKDYPENNIKYVNNFYEGFDSLGKNLYKETYKHINSREKFLDYISNVLPILSDEKSEIDYEELKKVSDDKIERIVYGLDYKIKFPYNDKQAVYISPYLQMNEGEALKFVTLGLSVTSRGLGKSITKAQLILEDKVLNLKVKYKDQSKFDKKGISVHEFEFDINTIEDLKLLDTMLSSNLSKIKFTFDDNNTYLYSLYEKDRVRNTLRFMSTMYTQIVLSYLFESKDIFDSSVFTMS